MDFLFVKIHLRFIVNTKFSFEKFNIQSVVFTVLIFDKQEEQLLLRVSYLSGDVLPKTNTKWLTILGFDFNTMRGEFGGVQELIQIEYSRADSLSNHLNLKQCLHMKMNII